MDIYTKKVITLTDKERNILRAAAEIMGELHGETDNSDFDYAETVLIDTYTKGTFNIEINE